MAGLVAVGVAIQVTKYYNRRRADKRMLSDVPPINLSARNLSYDHQIFSCLIDGVYARDNGRRNSATYFRAAGCREVTDPDILLEYDENQRVTTRSMLLRDAFIEPLVQSQICLFESNGQVSGSVSHYFKEFSSPPHSLIFLTTNFVLLSEIHGSSAQHGV